MVSLLLGACGGLGGGDAESWPSAPVDFSVGAGEGGGADLMARAIAQVIEAEELANQPFEVTNRPGGALCTAMTHLAENEGDAHVIMVWTGTILATEIRGACDVGYSDVTPIALIAEDPYLLMVAGDGPYQTLEDWVAAGADGAFNVGGGSEGGP